MKTAVLVMLSALLAIASCSAATDALPAGDAWQSAVETGVRALVSGPGGAPVSEVVLRLAVEVAVRELAQRGPEEAAPLVYEAAVRAELRLRLGEALPRVRAGLRQEFRIALRAGADAVEQLRTLEQVRRRLYRDPPAGGAPVPWWMGPGASRGRWGA
jgi:hypothetical protein